MMRLRALRVADVGHFTEPTALEGLGDGLNVLSGPNELGKSTLLRALEAVLFSGYGGKSAELRNLVPNGGRGAPVVEVDFEAQGRSWRVRKQFLSSPSATLADLGATTAALRNADADARLAELLAGPPDLERFKLLWVRQDQSLEPIKKYPLGAGLGGLIGQEIEAVALDARARQVHAAIVAELALLQTDSFRRPKGAYAAAIKARVGAEQRLAAAQAGFDAQAGRLEQLAVAVAARAALGDPAAAAARTDALAAAHARHARAMEAKQQRRLADDKRTTTLAALAAADREHKALTTTLDEFARLASEAERDGAAAAALHQRQADATAALGVAEAALAREADAVAALEAQLSTARQAERATEAAAARDRLAAVIVQAREAAAEAARRADQIARHGVLTAPRIAALRATVGELARLDAGFAAVAPEVVIALEAGGAGKIRVDGRPLADGITLHPDAPLTIDVAGVGRITIAPNPMTVSATRRAERDARRAEVDAALAEFGVGTLADAEARLAERQAAEAAGREAEARRKALAPNGVDALVAEHAALAALSAHAATPAPDATVAILEQRLATCRGARDAAALRLRATEGAVTTLAAEGARLDAAADARTTRRAAIAAQTGDPRTHAEQRARSAAVVATAREAYIAAQTAADAWAAAVGTATVETLAGETTAAAAAVTAATTRLAALDLQISGVEGELRVASDEDPEGELETAKAGLAAAMAKVTAFEDEVAALQRLDGEFSAIADAGRRELSGPILQRIAPYLERVLPGGTLELGGELTPTHIVRAGQREPHGQLSRGTQEQIAILVRLGLARLLADRNAAVPLILDDALVYADDDRIAGVFAALAEAARAHQVIVLNCRARTFSALAQMPGAKTLELQSWKLD